MNESSNPAAATAPRAGDIVVEPQGRADVRYTVRQVPGAVQFTVAARERAVWLARSFARIHDVDLWYCEDGTCTLVEAFR